MERLTLRTTPEEGGLRADVWLAARVEALSRSAAARLLEEGRVTRNGKPLAKRDRLTPGETVEVVNGVVYVTKTDGKTVQLDDSFVTKETPTGNYGPYTVPADSYFMMGDNRNHSEDSRFWQNKFVKKNKIVGKVEFRYYPKFSTID